MKHILTALGVSFALVAAAFAAPLNTKGIPADAVGVIHVDYEAAKTTPLGASLKETFLSSKAAARDYADFKKNAGVDPFADVCDFTVGILSPEPTETSPSGISPSAPKMPVGAAIIIRGKFSLEKFYAFAAKQKAPTVTIGKHVFYKEAGSLIFSPVDTGTVVAIKVFHYANRKKLEPLAKAVLAALSGETKFYATPASLTNFGKQTGTPIVLAHANVAPLQFPKPAQDDPMGVQAPDEIFLALGDTAGTLKLRGVATYPTESDAQQFLAKAQMGIGFAQMAIRQNIAKPDPNELRFSSGKKVKFYAECSKILSILKVTTTGKNFNALLDYSSIDVLAELFSDSNQEAVENAERAMQALRSEHH